MRTRKQQNGASILSILVGLIVAGIFFSVGFKLYTPYVDYKTIDSILTDVIQNQDELSKDLRVLKKDLRKKFTINQVRLPNKDALKITREKGVIRFVLDYEARVPMFYNVDALVVFKKEYEAIAP